MISAAQSNNIHSIKSTRNRWVGHVARMGGTRNAHRVVVARHKGRKSLGGDLGADGMIILKLNLYSVSTCTV